MQFYLNGYKPGDPFVEDPHPSVVDRPHGLPEEVDVLIVGCGPAGLVLAAQLANFPDIRTVVIDRKDGPLEVGQADGVACRTVEMFEAFGLADRLIHEGYWVNEVAFWRPDPQDRSKITRTGRIDDVEEGLSEMPHVIVNQARMLAYLLTTWSARPAGCGRSTACTPPTSRSTPSGAAEYPVTVTVAHLKDFEETGETSTIRAKYVVGADGSRSGVRAAIGRELVGDPMNQSWGVLDALATTDFPDIRRKCAIHSANAGQHPDHPAGGRLPGPALHRAGQRPRRGDAGEPQRHARRSWPRSRTGSCTRTRSTSRTSAGGRCTRSASGSATSSTTCPAEETGSRLPRVFIAGDACHTHSAKAGQGMNVSMNDTWNLGWKLAAVLRGHGPNRNCCTPTPTNGRRSPSSSSISTASSPRCSAPTRQESGEPSGDGVDPEEFQQYFITQGRFTAGVATKYAPSMITAEPMFEHLAEGFPVGMRFHSAPVVRLADAKPVHLGHAARADGAWRLYVFADRNDPTARLALRELCEFLASDASPITRFTPKGADPDSVIDVRAIFQQGHRDLAVDAMPSVLLPRRGNFGLVDYEKMFCPDRRPGHLRRGA